MLKRIIFFICYIGYAVLLYIFYTMYLLKVYVHDHFYNNMTKGSLAISIVLLFFVGLYVFKKRIKTPSDVVVYSLVLINLVPNIVLYAFMPISPWFLTALVVYWCLLLSISSLFNRYSINGTRIKSPNNSIFIVVISILSLFTILFVGLRFTGFSFDLSSVYTQRSLYLNAQLPTLLTYLYAAIKVFNPIVCVYFLINKKYGFALISGITQILAFACDGSKSSLFSFVLVIVIYLYIRISKKKIKLEKMSLFIIFGVFLLLAIGLFEQHFIKTTYVNNYVTRRLLFVPAQLNEFYFDFFESHVPDFFRQSFLRHFGFASPYNRDIANIIGANYFNTPDQMCNNGLLSDAFMNFGFVGVFIMPFLVFLFLKLFNRCADHLDQIYLIPCFVSIVYTFLSSSLFTVLLTHGFLFTCIILLMLPRRRRAINEKKCINCC